VRAVIAETSEKLDPLVTVLGGLPALAFGPRFPRFKSKAARFEVLLIPLHRNPAARFVPADFPPEKVSGKGEICQAIFHSLSLRRKVIRVRDAFPLTPFPFSFSR
jgi:hypothetical protein